MTWFRCGEVWFCAWKTCTYRRNAACCIIFLDNSNGLSPCQVSMHDEATYSYQTHRQLDMSQMDVLKLPCAAPWGAPPAGMLFTADAFARYSVSSRQVGSTPCGSNQSCANFQPGKFTITACAFMMPGCFVLPQVAQHADAGLPLPPASPLLPGRWLRTTSIVSSRCQNGRCQNCDCRQRASWQ